MKRITYIYLMLVGMLVGCQPSQRYFPKDVPSAEVRIARFDNALYLVQRDTLPIETDVEHLYGTFPDFMSFWTENIIGIPSTDTAALIEALPRFLNDTVYGFRDTNYKVHETFRDTRALQEELNHAFGCIRYLWPEMKVPTLWMFISGFNASLLFTEDDDIAIGADMYLGSDYPYYNRVVYDYQKQTMRPECIGVDVVSAYLFRHIEYTSVKSRLLEQMIYRGKVMWLVSELFPHLPEYEIMGYSEKQWEWCCSNEQNIWNMMMDRRDLFTTNTLQQTSYLNDGPFTAEISQEAPARLGTWIGMHIVDSYMRHNPDVSIQQLMAEGDAQLILENSKYKP